MHVAGIMMNFIVNFLICLSEIRTFVHDCLQIVGLLPKVIKINFAFLQRQNKLLERVARIDKGSIVFFGVRVPAATTSQASGGFPMPLM